MVTEFDAATALVFRVKIALVAPAGTGTLGGTLATDGSLLESVTCASPAGAGPLNVTVPVEGFPPVTVVGFSDTEERVGSNARAKKLAVICWTPGTALMLCP
jgi:hypothetical protein